MIDDALKTFTIYTFVIFSLHVACTYGNAELLTTDRCNIQIANDIALDSYEYQS